MKTWDNDGSNYFVLKNRIKTIQQSFFYDIAETGSQNFTEIEIQVFDHDILRTDKQIDINPATESTSITLRLYHDTNTIVSNTINEGNDAQIEYTVTLPTEIKPTDEKIDKTFQWRFMNELHEISFDMPFHKYEWAMQSTVNRTPQLFGTETMADFVTTDDSVIESIADSLEDLAQNQGFNKVETVNFVMSFVQQNIQYVEDNASKGYNEYWRYPVETLVDEIGDCEDTSVLFASIIENMDYDAVLLFYIVDEDIGHLATGVSGVDIQDGDSERYDDASYYYCETTSVGFRIGEKPKDIPEKAEKIIPVN
jgi:predicted transglutaminase-like cysteine proteinase